LTVRQRRISTFSAAASGALLFLASPGLTGWWPVAWFALIPLFMSIREASPAQAGRYGLVAGLVYYLPLLSWIIIVLGTYGHLAWWISLAALVLLSLYMSLYFAVFGAAVAWVVRKGGSPVWFAPPLWVILEFGRAHLLSGFPWQDLAYSQYSVPMLIQIVDVTGHYGMSYLVVLVNSFLFVLFLDRPRGKVPDVKTSLRSGEVLFAAAIIFAALCYDYVRYHQVEAGPADNSINVAVIQGNIAQDLKWTPQMQTETLEIYRQLSEDALESRGSGLPLLVWPETALPFYPQNNRLFDMVVQSVRGWNGWLLTGTPYYVLTVSSAAEDPDAPRSVPRYYNSALLLGPDGVVADRYDKQHLVPFGEYVPLRRYLPFLSPLVESVNDFSAGTFSQPLACQKARIGVLICFESIFPKLAAGWAEKGANLLVNITNDAWFGRSNAPWQHLSMAVFRAVETRRSLVRSANTGVSCVVDPLGRIVESSPLFKPFFLTADVPLVEGRTMFVRYPDGFVIVNVLGLILALALLKKKRQP